MARKKRSKELSMRKIQEVLRLHLSCGMGPREISRSLSISPATASTYINAAKEADLSYGGIRLTEVVSTCSIYGYGRLPTNVYRI